ncbi:MAG: Gfo/Idh/MocA family oxidoreductase [Phycisphaerales bacterium]|nr:MAG: Gfo/Idh/MocA family oxidoreductase [Phycisphaerales bacterium]
MKGRVDRRQLLKGSIIATATSCSGLLSLTRATERIVGANERVNVGWIGCGGRGFNLYTSLRKIPDVEVTAVCDVYAPHAQRAQRWVGERCRMYKDFRNVLDLKDIDAVLIATPDHWHAIPTVLACQAQKDVYVEKPLGHNVREGRAMVLAARHHRRIIQTGTQQRSAEHFARVREIIRTGDLGPISIVRIWNYMNMHPDGIGQAQDEAPPKGLDWDFYLGPAPKRSFNRKRFLGTFRYFWDYAGGSATDLGTHRFDILHYLMGAEAPLTVSAVGGRFALKDAGEVPDTLLATFEYPGFVLTYEASLVNGFGTGSRTPGRRYYRARGPSECPFGMAFYGTNGTLFADRLGYEIFRELRPGLLAPDDAQGAPDLYRMKPQAGASGAAELAHLQNFIDCVRSRKRPVADVEDGHRASNVAHLANIAFKTGRKLRWDAEKELLIDDNEAAVLLARDPRAPWDMI